MRYLNAKLYPNWITKLHSTEESQSTAKFSQNEYLQFSDSYDVTSLGNTFRAVWQFTGQLGA